MPVIGVTGGIASGKSSVTLLLGTCFRETEGLTVETFSADACAHDLLEKDPDVLDAVVEIFGNVVIDESGQVSRAVLRGIVFQEPEKRTQLEAVLHPRIRRRWETQAERFRQPTHYYVAEIPLLYETGCEILFDSVIVVEASAQIQIERLSSKRGWSLETARQVIDAQMPAEQKIRKANILILNHHTEKLLAHQVKLAARALITRYA